MNKIADMDTLVFTIPDHAFLELREEAKQRGHDAYALGGPVLYEGYPWAQIVDSLRFGGIK